MEAHSRWYEDIAKEISQHKDWLTQKDYKKYKLDLLLRLSARADDFSNQCGQCQLLQQDIATLTHDLSYLIQMSDKEKRKGYLKKINDITKHLQKQHKLVNEGYYLGIGIAIGTGIGVTLGIALDNPGIGPVIGIGIGVAIGKYLDNKAKKEGRVI